MIHLKKIRAFSLIELVIVLTILAVLAIVSIPSYLRYMERASLAEAIAILGQYKTSFGVMWSTQSKLPTTGDILTSSPVNLPFGAIVTTELPDSIESVQLTSSGNGDLIKIILKSSVFSTYPSNNRQLSLGVKPTSTGSDLQFTCGNFSTNAATSIDIGFTDPAILPSGCNYNGVGAWLGS